MDQAYQAAAPRRANVSKTTQGLVLAYHLLLGAYLVGSIALLWIRSSSADDQSTLEFASGLAIFLALVCFLIGWGIWQWKNWARMLGLILRWLNVGATVLSVAQIRISPQGAVGTMLSCLVLWWLYEPAVKLQFRSGSGT